MAASLEAGLATAGDETLVLLDPNCRPLVIRDRAIYLARVHRMIARADVVKVSTDDLAYLSPGEGPSVSARRLLDRGPAVVLVTDGPRPVIVMTRDDARELAVPTVRVVDTIGAGDAFGGAFIARWLEGGWGRDDLADGAALSDAVAFAIEVARLTCQRPGADPPRRAELRRPLA
jgi:fructokinase